jgi:hypothetical protein
MRLCTTRMSSDENVASLFRQPRPLSPLWTSHSICRTRQSLIRTAPAFERLPVTVTEADLLRDIQIHFPVNESDFLQSRRADSRSTQASTGSVF